MSLRIAENLRALLRAGQLLGGPSGIIPAWSHRPARVARCNAVRPQSEHPTTQHQTQHHSKSLQFLPHLKTCPRKSTINGTIKNTSENRTRERTSQKSQPCAPAPPSCIKLLYRLSWSRQTGLFVLQTCFPLPTSKSFPNSFFSCLVIQMAPWPPDTAHV